MILDEKDNSCIIPVKLNETIEIKVKENPSTCSHWVIEIGDDKLRPIDTLKSDVDTDFGVSRYRTFRIKAMKKGKSTINTIQTRNWIKVPIKKLEFIINVQ